MNLSDLLKIGAADEPQKLTAKVMGHDIEFYVKPNSAADDFAQFNDSIELNIIDKSGNQTGDNRQYYHYAARRIARHLVDADGNLILTAEQAIKQKRRWILDVDAAIHAQLSGMTTEESVEETAKN